MRDWYFGKIIVLGEGEYMLEGIQVLHEIEKCTADSGNIIMGIVLGLFALLMLFMVILSIRDEDDLFGFFFIALLISGFFFAWKFIKIYWQD